MVAHNNKVAYTVDCRVYVAFLFLSLGGVEGLAVNRGISRVIKLRADYSFTFLNNIICALSDRCLVLDMVP